jgi:hypothetical protein
VFTDLVFQTAAGTQSASTFADQSLTSFLCAQPALQALLPQFVTAKATLSFFQIMHSNVAIADAVAKLDAEVGTSHPSYTLFLLLLLRNALQRALSKADHIAAASDANGL